MDLCLHGSIYTPFAVSRQGETLANFPNGFRPAVCRLAGAGTPILFLRRNTILLPSPGIGETLANFLNEVLAAYFPTLTNTMKHEA